MPCPGRTAPSPGRRHLPSCASPWAKRQPGTSPRAVSAAPGRAPSSAIQPPPLSTQLASVRRVPGGELHLAALRALRDAAGSRPVYDPAVQADLHMFDLHCADFSGDPADVREDAVDSGIQPGDIPSLVREAASLDGVAAPGWTPLDGMPGRGPQLDALRARLFGDLTDIPLGRVMAALHPHAEAGNPLDGFVAWLRETGEPRPLGTTAGLLEPGARVRGQGRTPRPRRRGVPGRRGFRRGIRVLLARPGATRAWAETVTRAAPGRPGGDGEGCSPESH